MPFGKKISSEAQARMMNAICHSASRKARSGPTRQQACEMISGQKPGMYNRLPERKGKRRKR
jgi:hypothetical protein